MTEAMAELLRKQRTESANIHAEACEKIHRIGELAARHVFIAAAGHIPPQLQTAVQEMLLPDHEPIVVNNG